MKTLVRLIRLLLAYSVIRSDKHRPVPGHGRELFATHYALIFAVTVACASPPVRAGTLEDLQVFDLLISIGKSVRESASASAEAPKFSETPIKEVSPLIKVTSKLPPLRSQYSLYGLLGRVHLSRWSHLRRRVE